jgi:hypothetical protein
MLLGGVVHEYVELAELLKDAVHHFARCRFVPESALDGETATALFLDEAACLTRIVVLLEVDEADVCTFSCKGMCNCAPYAAVAARDKCHAPL